jgi:hypothetical protein
LPPFAGLASLAAALALGVAACGGSGEAPTDTGSVPSSGAPIPGGGLTIDEALASTLPGPLVVKGFVVAPEGEPVRLCSLLLESYPPQCGGTSLVVVGLDLSTVDGLVQTAEPDLAQVSWTDAEGSILGEIEDGVLTVAPAAG